MCGPVHTSSLLPLTRRRPPAAYAAESESDGMWTPKRDRDERQETGRARKWMSRSRLPAARLSPGVTEGGRRGGIKKEGERRREKDQEEAEEEEEEERGGVEG